MPGDLRHLLTEAQNRLRDGQSVAMATVVATRGSTPQKAGAHMLIGADGSLLGTIGGGCIEAEVWTEARRLMRQGQSALREFVLADDPDHPGATSAGGRWKSSSTSCSRSVCAVARCSAAAASAPTA